MLLNLNYKIFGIFLFFIALSFLFLNPSDFTKPPNRKINFAWPAEYIEHLVLGYKFQVADSLWLRFIQDIDYKDNNSKNIHLGWGYRMADAITNLDPRYRVVYSAAGVTISVIVEDKEGARLLLEKGVKNVPEDWGLSYKLGYHYLYELKNCEKAAHYLNMAASRGAPPWLTSLTARLYTAEGQYDIAEKITLENIDRFKNTPIVEQLKARLEEIKLARNNVKIKHNSQTLCK